MLIGALALLHLGALALAHGEARHYLEGQVLCVDNASIIVQLDNVETSRKNAARPGMLNHLKGALRSSLQGAKVAADFAASCAGSESYVVVVARVTALDQAVYRRYGREGFGYTLSVQVGNYADATYLDRHYILPNLRFDAFVEEAFTERRHAPFEQSVRGQSQSLLDALSEAWHEDNP